VNVIPNRLVCQSQFIGNLFVCKTAGKQLNQLLLAAGEPKSGFHLEAGYLIQLARRIEKQCLAQLRRANCFATGDRANRGCDLCGGCIRENETQNAFPHQIHKSLFVIIQAYDDDPELWDVLLDFAKKFFACSLGGESIYDKDIRPSFDNLDQAERREVAGPGHRQVSFLI